MFQIKMEEGNDIRQLDLVMIVFVGFYLFDVVVIYNVMISWLFGVEFQFIRLLWFKEGKKKKYVYCWL